MRKFVALAAVALVGLIVARKSQEQQEEQALWAEVTDSAPPTPVRGAN